MTHPLRRLKRRVVALFSRDEVEADLRDELEFHIAMQARKHRDRGLSEEDAMRQARLEFGNAELVKEDARDARGIRPVEELFADVKYALRGLRRAPLFALSVILTISLGVGINASAFTIFDSYVLRPIDVRDPYSLYSASWMDRRGHVHNFSREDLDALRRPSAMLTDVVAYQPVTARVSGLPALGDAVSTNFFAMTGVRPALGRVLVGDDRGSAVVVLSHAAWQGRFAGDSSIVGRPIVLRGQPFRVVGVAQDGFTGFFKKPRDFWLPVDVLARLDSAVIGVAGTGEPYSLLLRARPGVSSAQAGAAVLSAMQATMAARPDSSRITRAFIDSRATAIPQSVGSYLAFAPIAVAFGLVLLLACANVANMLLARGLARRREFGIRLALGASRSRLVRQLVTESVVLALPSVVLGFALSVFVVDSGVRVLFATLPADLAAFVRLVPLHPDARVLVFSLIVAIGSAFLFSLAPSLHATRLSIVQATRGEFAARSSPHRLRRLLIVAQVAVASLLLITAAALLREAGRLGRMQTGLRTRDVLSIEIENDTRAAVLASLGVNRLVDGIAAAEALPLDMRFPSTTVTRADSTLGTMPFNRVSASYFDLLGIALASGRTFSSDEERGGRVVIVSASAARQLWAGTSPLGRTIHLRLREDGGKPDPLLADQDARVVGVARDVAVGSVEDGSARPVLYFPAAVAAPSCCLLVRVRGEAAAAKREIDAELARVVPGGVDRIDRLDTFEAGAIYPYRAAYWLSLVLGVLALGLTAIGVYGVVSYLIGQRLPEIGIRIALGATSRDVLALVLGQSVRQALVGGVVGATAALVVTIVLASNIQTMPAFDAIAFAGGLACVFGACMAAALVPSRAATRVDPTLALRSE